MNSREISLIQSARQRGSDRRTAPAAGAPTTVAAADLGSNSFHMIVARMLNGQVHVLDRLQETVRLAGGLDQHNRLDGAAQRRALACLERFGQRLQGVAAGSVRVVGTNTLRRARNARKFLAAAERALGHRIEVISGQEEARLIYQGVVRNLPDDGGRRLVVDIGGGSTEFIVGDGYEPTRMESLHMGCVGMSLKYFPRGVINARALQRAQTAAHLELQPIATAFRRMGWNAALGASGTVRAIAGVVQANASGAPFITLPALHKLRETLLSAGRVEHLELPGLNQERAPIFAGGFTILLAAFEALQIERMDVAEGALREGLLYDLVGRLGQQDVRARTIAALSERYQIDTAQAQRVEGTVRYCAQQVRAAWSLDADDVTALGRAARLHEIGLAIAHTKYHKHGAYIVEHSELPGFSYEEQRLLAALIRGHRRRFSLQTFEDMPRAQRRIARRLCVLLRLAVLLHRARAELEPPEFRVKAGKRSLALAFPRAWLDGQPLTHADLKREKQYLRAAGMRLEYR